MMDTRILRRALFACMLVLCASWTTATCAAANLKDFTAFSFIDNREINTADMRGTILVLVFGSIYCKPCVELLPVMDTLQERYCSSDVRVILLDIDMAVDPDLQRAFVKRQSIRNPYIVNAFKVARDNKVFMLPTTLIVNRKGEVVKRIMGFKKIRTFEKALKKLRPLSAVPETVAGHDHEQGHH